MVSNIILAVAVAIAALAGATFWREGERVLARLDGSWVKFTTATLGTFSLIYGLFFAANGLLRYSSSDGGAIDVVYFVWFPVLATAIGVGTGRVATTRSASNERIGAIAGGLAVLGLVTALFLRSQYLPSIAIVPLLLCTVIGAAIGLGLSMLSGDDRTVGGLIGTAAGFALGAWGFPGLGDGNIVWALVSLILPLALIGAAIGLAPPREYSPAAASSLGPVARVPGLAFAMLWILIPLTRALKGTESGDKILNTLILVVVAVAASGGIWVGANLLFNQVRPAWNRFATLALALGGFFFGILLSGNRILRFSSIDNGSTLQNLLYLLWFPLLAAAIGAAIGIAMNTTNERTVRTAIGAVGVGALGAVAGAFVRAEYFPEFSLATLVPSTLVGAAILGGIAALRRRPPIAGALYGAALGWVFGAWAFPTLGVGSQVWTVIAIAVPAALVGAGLGWSPIPDHTRRDQIDQTSRAVTFVGPAFLFIVITLVAPAIRTLLLSLQDDAGENWIWLKNYQSVLGRADTLDLSNWSAIFTSRLFYVAVILIIATILLGLRGKAQSGKFVELGGASSFPMLGAFIFLAFAAFSVLRGTLINNLWWVVVVVVFSTALGLMVAVLADARSGEKVAKSFIFMPMALSLVGASVIWRFMYVARDASIDQTGVMNALWVGLGKLSTGRGIPTYLVGGLAIAVLALLLFIAGRSLLRADYGGAVVPGIAAMLMFWFTVRFWMPGGVGGVVPDAAGGYKPDTIFFIQNAPFNNVWLMVVLVWIQTGFAMVILSAAIQAVPDELLEAARVDGATPTQVFWRVTLPQIATTIGVVVTTLIVLVMKVYDIVKVMTNGNFGTQVLANDMFNTAFQIGNYGEGAALAVLILILVLPVMIYNIYNMQKES